MPTPRIFIDGHAGTTGLRIREWLAQRSDLEIWTLEESERKSEPARRKAIAEADLTVLCLPDAAAIEAAGWALESGARMIDASSAHRVAEGWVYGLPELSPGHRNVIANAQLVSNPGCYPSIFVPLIRPLMDVGILASDAPLSIHGLSGYSGRRKGADRGDGNRQLRAGSDCLSRRPMPSTRSISTSPIMQALRSPSTIPPQFVPSVGAYRLRHARRSAGPRESLARGQRARRGSGRPSADRYEGEPLRPSRAPLSDASRSTRLRP